MKEDSTDHYIGKRVVATLIDYTIVWAFAFFYIWEFGEPNNRGGHTVSGWPALVPLLFWFIYIVCSERFLDGTLGHLICKIKVISMTRENITLWRTFKRRIVDALEIAWCFGLIAYLIAMNTKDHQRLGDLLAQTSVAGKNDLEAPVKFDFER
jgi:uncharacterized RDD family membrane protein YckC